MTAINSIHINEVNNFEEFPMMNKYQNIASGSAIYPGQGTPLGLIYCSLKLNGEAGELAEHVGKAMRDDALMEPVLYDVADKNSTDPEDIFSATHDLTPERRTLIIKEVGDCLWYLSAICRELGINMSDAALLNLQKLYDRQQRGALQGSGDER